MSLPDRIIIVGGRLKMADGTSLRVYLKQWQESNAISDGTKVNVVLRDKLLPHAAIENPQYRRVNLSKIKLSPGDELALAS